MESHVLSYWLWAIQLAREVQCANLGPYDSSSHHCATRLFVYCLSAYGLLWVGPWNLIVATREPI